MDSLKHEICDRHGSIWKWKRQLCTLDLRCVTEIDWTMYAFYICTNNNWAFYHMSKITDDYFWRYWKKNLLSNFK